MGNPVTQAAKKAKSAVNTAAKGTMNVLLDATKKVEKISHFGNPAINEVTKIAATSAKKIAVIGGNRTKKTGGKRKRRKTAGSRKRRKTAGRRKRRKTAGRRKRRKTAGRRRRR